MSDRLRGVAQLLPDNGGELAEAGGFEDVGGGAELAGERGEECFLAPALTIAVAWRSS
ncbi:hypothetical protein [Streptomyces sp. NPDC048340]|uniref:hypothetical protein n=1 Tax=Streptomyces sp. NPDC048340 TaxID=3365537 RepID=UPI003715B4AC